MKLVEDKTRYDVDSFGSKSISMEIDASNTGILFSILSENLYSDIYGSIIRELVSNQFMYTLMDLQKQIVLILVL
jgi:hypothetical protein